MSVASRLPGAVLRIPHRVGFWLSVAALIAVPERCQPKSAGDPFYDWGLERYRILRSPDDPTGSILPLPPLRRSALQPAVTAMALIVEADGFGDRPPVEEADGLRRAGGARARLEVEGFVPLLWGLRGEAAFRGRVGEGGRSAGTLLERSLVWSTDRVEVRAGLTRSFWGDGDEGSILLGRTAPPLEMLRVRSVRPWRLPFSGDAGRIHASLFLAYLDDRWRAVPFPLLHGARLDWEPTAWLRVGAARTILFGGSKRTEKLQLSDVVKILLAQDENRKGPRTVSDSDQKASFAFELRLPPELRPLAWIEGARFFYEYAGEDAFEDLVPTTAAHLTGGSVLVDGWTALAEFSETTDDSNHWYVLHSVYGRDAYFYRGFCMGHPMGGDGVSGHLRVWSPVRGLYQIQAWLRARAAWDRTIRDTAGYRQSLGFSIRRGLPDGPIAEGGFEITGSRGDLRAMPRSPFDGRVYLAMRWGAGGPDLAAGR